MMLMIEIIIKDDLDRNKLGKKGEEIQGIKR